MKLDTRWLRIFTGTGIVASLALSGCGREEITAPEPQAGPEFAVPVHGSGDSSSGLLRNGILDLLALVQKVEQFVDGTLLPDASRTQTIGPEGGVVVADRYTITVPPLAVSEPTEFEIRYFEDGTTMFELLPHGVQFAVPVTIEMDLEGTTLENAYDVTLYWYDESAEKWVDVGGSWSRRDSRLVGTTDHFSKWGGGRSGW